MIKSTPLAAFFNFSKASPPLGHRLLAQEERRRSPAVRPIQGMAGRALGLMILAGMILPQTGFAWQQRAQAEQDAAGKSRASKAGARQPTEAIQSSLRKMKKKMGALENWKTLGSPIHQAVDHLQQFGKKENSSKNPYDELFTEIDALKNRLLAQNELAGALIALVTRVEICEYLAEREPDQDRWKRSLIRSYGELGDILAEQEEWPEALAVQRAGLEITQQMGEKAPNDLTWPRESASGYDKIGDILLALGNFTEALTAYRSGLERQKFLVEHAPDNPEWLHLLAMGHYKIGDLLTSQRKLTEALTAYHSGLEISKRLVERHPDHAAGERDLFVGHDRLGNILVAQKDFSGALAIFQAGLEISKRLAERHPEQPKRQHDLIASYERTGNMLAAQGNLNEALTHFQAGLTLSQRLVAQYPKQPEWQQDLITSHEKMGMIFEHLGRMEESIAHYQKEIDLGGAFAQNFPDQPPIPLNHPRNRLLFLLGSKGELTAMDRLLVQMIGENPSDTKLRMVHASTLDKMGRTAEAILRIREAIQMQPQLGKAHGMLGWYLIEQGKWAEGEESAAKAHALEPKNGAWTVKLAHTHLLQGDREGAYTLYREAIPQITNQATLDQGPLADFKLFIEKGWQVEACRQAGEWLQKTWSQWHEQQDKEKDE